MKNKKKKVALLTFLCLFIVLALFIVTTLSFMTGKLQITTNKTDFKLSSVTEIEKSLKNNGSWWGYNQTKLSSINGVVFTFIYDNSNFENGNPSVSNPFKCRFVMIDGETQTEFGFGYCDRPCNVITDIERNLVYYFVNEPTRENPGSNGYTGFAKTVMHLYSFNPGDKEITLVKKQDIIPESSVGKIRAGADIDGNGNIIFCYGQYDGILKAHIYDYPSDTWTEKETLTNNEGDSLMYAYAQIKDTSNFYVLCVQDTATDNATYYQYVKMFAYENGVWSDYMVADYRNESIAKKETALVEHTELKLIGNDLHIMTRSKELNEIKHYIYRDGGLFEQNVSFLSKKSLWIRLVPLNAKIYYVYNIDGLYPSLNIVDFSSGKKVFSCTGIPYDAYLYIDPAPQTEFIRLLAIPSSDGFVYDNSALKYIVLKAV